MHVIIPHTCLTNGPIQLFVPFYPLSSSMPRLILLTLLVFAEAYLGDILIKIPYCDQEHFELKHLKVLLHSQLVGKLTAFLLTLGTTFKLID